MSPHCECFCSPRGNPFMGLDVATNLKPWRRLVPCSSQSIRLQRPIRLQGTTSSTSMMCKPSLFIAKKPCTKAWHHKTVLLTNLEHWSLQVFIAIAVILGDGLYNFVKIVYKSGRDIYIQHNARNQLPVANAGMIRHTFMAMFQIMHVVMAILCRYATTVVNFWIILLQRSWIHWRGTVPGEWRFSWRRGFQPGWRLRGIFPWL